MRQFKLIGAALGAALLVAACGGGSDDVSVAPPPIRYTSMVSFGDSLSDVGTYKVGTVAALGGGLYTVNGVTGAIASTNWTELVAAQVGVAAPCPAQTGLDGDATKGFSVLPVAHAGCFNYAMGGARVTDPVGPGNKLLGGANATLGQLTVPIVTQIANHLSRVGGSFSGTELVSVMAGANDLFRLSDTLVANATAAGSQAFASSLAGQLAAGAPNPATAAPAIGLALQTEAAKPASTDASIVGAAVTAAVIAGNTAAASPAIYGPMVATAQAAGAAAGSTYAKTNGAAQAVFPMGEAGKQLGIYIKSQIVGKGAKYVAVVNMPDASVTPSALSQSADTQGLILNMVIYFNEALKSELQGVPGVQIVDLFTQTRNFSAKPATFGLTNVTSPACNLGAPSPNALGSSLVCNVNNLIPGDVSHYLYADRVHPTPYGYKLFADQFIATLKQARWL